MGKARDLVVGFDLGGTKMIAAVFDAHNKVLGSFKMRTEGAKGEEAILGRMVECFQGALAAAKVAATDLGGMGVGSPGPLDPFAGVIIDTPNMRLKDFPLRARLEAALNLTVRVDNDVNMGTYGEWLFGAGQGAQHLVGVFPGTGIGGGLILDGKLYRGATGAAGEVGHMILDPGGPLCGCGQYGCLEAYASRLALAKEAAAMAARGDSAFLAEKVGTDVALIRSKPLARAVKAGDEAMIRVVMRSAEYLGMGLANLVHILNPDTIVLGGGLVDAMPSEYVERIDAAMRRYAQKWMVAKVKIKRAALGDLAVAMGAGQLIREALGLTVEATA